MSKDLNKPRYRKLYRREFDIAQKALAARKGTLEWSPHDYEAFVWVEDGARIVFYPHRTSAGNYHLRVRDGGSKDKALADHVMKLLDDAVPHDCTFTRASRTVRDIMRSRRTGGKS